MRKRTESLTPSMLVALGCADVDWSVGRRGGWRGGFRERREGRRCWWRESREEMKSVGVEGSGSGWKSCDELRT